MEKFAKFKINIEIEKLKIQIEGDRQIAPEIATNVANQISTMLQPAAYIEAPKDGQNSGPVIEGGASASPRRSRRRSGVKQSSPVDGSASSIDWSHDTGKWGTPLQSWKQWQKIAWLLCVVEAEGVRANGLTPTEMTDLFKNKFRSAGLLTRQTIGRDLGNNPNYFGETDGRWFLKQSGKEMAANLITEGKGEKVNTATA